MYDENTAFFLCHNTQPEGNQQAFSIWELDPSLPRPEAGKNIPEEYVDDENITVLEIFEKDNPVTSFLLLQHQMDAFYQHSDGQAMDFLHDLINAVGAHAKQLT